MKQRSSASTFQVEFEELQSLYRTAPVGIGLVDRELRYVRVNDRLAEYSGVPLEEMVGRRTREVVPKIAPKTEPIYKRVFETGEAVLDVEVAGRTAADPGRERWWLASYSPLLTEDAEVWGVSLLVKDITEQKHAQLQLQKRVALMELVAEIGRRFINAPPGEIGAHIDEALQRVGEFFETDAARLGYLTLDGEILPSSHVWLSDGCDAEELTPIIFERTYPDLAKVLIEGGCLIVNSVDEFAEWGGEAEIDFVRKMGIKASVIVSLGSSKGVVEAFALDMMRSERIWSEATVESAQLIGRVLSNAARRASAEEQLLSSLADSREAEGRFRQLAENVPGLFTHLDRDLRYRFSNREHRQVVGRRLEEIVGCSVAEVLGEESAELLQPYLDRTLAGEAMKWEFELIRPTGGKGWFLGQTVPEVAEDGSVTGMFGITTDISEIKETEESLREALAENERLQERLEAENIYLQKRQELTHGHREIIGESEAMRKMLAAAEQVAITDSTVLILGETGTGKELLARWIHRLSTRRRRVMVEVNCAGLPATLVESELFGREKGAYTGALAHQKGRFEIADGSTIFLDEVGELAPELQTKLLRVLQEGRFERLGNPRPLQVDVRVIAATNRDLAAAMREKSFREDLFYRLNVFPITVPPLRERPEDIPLLVWAFVGELGKEMGKSIERIPRREMEALQSHGWPGNVRELRNVVERAMILSGGETLHFEVAGTSASRVEQAVSFEEAQRRHIVAVLERCDWRVRGAGGAAEALELKPTTLEFKMKKLGIKRPDRESG